MEWAKVENYETQLLCILLEELAGGEKRVSYNLLAARLGCARSTVRYNVGKLMSSRIIGCRGGKLYLIEG